MDIQTTKSIDRKQIQIPLRTWEKLKKFSAKSGDPISRIVRELVDKNLK